MRNGNQQSPPAGEGANGAPDRKAGIWVYPGFLLVTVLLGLLLSSGLGLEGPGVGVLAVLGSLTFALTLELLMRAQRLVGRMATRPIGWIGLALLLVTGGLLAVPSIRTAALGYVRGEPFYQNAPSSSWVKRLKDQNPDARQGAAAELRGGGARAVPVLVVVLEFGDPRDSSFVDGRLSEHSAADNELHALAATTLGEIGREANRSIPALLALARGDHRYRTEKEEPGGFGFYMSEKAREDSKQRELTRTRAEQAAERALEKIVTPDSLSDLGTALTEKSYRTRILAARLLGTLGRGAAPAVPALRELVNDPEERVRAAASEALKRIGTGG